MDIEPNREAYILTICRLYYNGSRDHRQKAIDHLGSIGYTEEEISEALRRETRRLQAYGEHLRNGLTETITTHTFLPPVEPPQECSCHGTNHDERVPRA